MTDNPSKPPRRRCPRVDDPGVCVSSHNRDGDSLSVLHGGEFIGLVSRHKGGWVGVAEGIVVKARTAEAAVNRLLRACHDAQV